MFVVERISFEMRITLFPFCFWLMTKYLMFGVEGSHRLSILLIPRVGDLREAKSCARKGLFDDHNRL